MEQAAPAAPHALALVGLLAALLGAVVVGVLLGLRIATRDAATLLVTKREAAAALAGAEAAVARCDALQEAWTLQVSKVERLRASTTAAASRAEAAARKEQPEEPPAEPLPADINERRRAVQRRLVHGRAS